MQEVVYRQTYVGYWPADVPARIISFIVSAVEFVLAIRLILVLFGASPSAQFVAWFYDLTAGPVAPFSGAFPNLSLGGFILETSTLLTMIAYALLGWLAMALISSVSPAR